MSKKVSVVASVAKKIAGSAKNAAANASSKPVKAAGKKAGKNAKPVADDTKHAKHAKRAAGYSAMKIVGFKIQAMIDGKNTVEGIAKKVGCTIARVRRHTDWLNRGKTPVVQELKNGTIKPLVENVAAGQRKTLDAYQS